MIVDESTLALKFSRPPGRTFSTVNGKLLLLGTSVIQADATVRILPQVPKEILLPGWKLGFIQLQLQETNWGYYRGAKSEDGSLLVNSGNMPARAVDVCRDSEAEGMIWYTGAGPDDSLKETKQKTSLPWDVPMFYFGDQPSGEFKLEQTNPTTGKPNFLEEAKLKLSFLTTLTLRDHRLNYTHLLHFEWSVSWHARREAADAYPLLRGSGSTLSPVRKGPPKDPALTALLTDETRRARCCNEVSTIAGMHPLVTSAAAWQRFPAMR